MRRHPPYVAFAAIALVCACAAPAPSRPSPSLTAGVSPSAIAPTPEASPARVVHTAETPCVAGEPITLADLSGRIVTDDFEDVFAMDVDGSDFVRIAANPAGPEFDGSWSPDGSTVAFMSVRDDCGFATATAECWRVAGEDEHHDIWAIRPDGTGLRRVTPELGQFVTWSPDGRFLLISGHALFVVRPDGTGRLELRTPEMPRALGGMPDWHP